jgi:hypothetical protein
MQNLIEVKDHLEHHIQNESRQIIKLELKTFGKCVTREEQQMGFTLMKLGAPN